MKVKELLKLYNDEYMIFCRSNERDVIGYEQSKFDKEKQADRYWDSKIHSIYMEDGELPRLNIFVDDNFEKDLKVVCFPM